MSLRTKDEVLKGLNNLHCGSHIPNIALYMNIYIYIYIERERVSFNLISVTQACM